MRGVDRFLIGIAAGALLLVAVAFAVALTRPRPSYQPENGPEAVAHNYLFAIQEEEYQRAYSYLSPTLEGYPSTFERFEEDLETDPWQFNLDDSDTVFAIEPARVTGDRAEVQVRETTFYSDGLFGNQYTRDFDMTLQQTDGTWKITYSDSHWLSCWNDPRGCDGP